MEKIREIEIAGLDGVITKHVIIDHGNEQFTSMPKAVWDELQARQTEGGLN